MKPTVLAVTLGDPGGIGPEIALKSAARGWPRSLRLVLIGDRGLLAREARRLRLPLPPVWNMEREPAPAAAATWSPAETAGGRAASRAWRPGLTGRAQGRAGVRWVQAAVAGCLAGIFDGMVTGPVCKKSLQLAGLPATGHTEYLALLTGAGKYAMLLLGGGLRVALVTRHVPVSGVAPALTRDGIVETAKLTARALRWLGARNRLIGVCGLNPHCGDQGALGGEERAVIIPAVRILRRAGIEVEGPIPGDVVFHLARRGRFGAVLAMYHDQGLAPLKMLAFESGVNLTLGLPIIRTSPDHGTAFDIAGQGRADPGSMIAAIRLAARLARRGNPWKTRPGKKDNP